jgi:murein hydrolase activator
MPVSRARVAWGGLLLLALLALLAPGVAPAQQGRETERKLEQVRRELREVAAERRRLEGKRGAASRELRTLDERVADTLRELRATEAALARQQARVSDLVVRRDALQATLSDQRRELAALLRAAYTVGGAAPLKLMLAPDGVAEANRNLAYHGYLQRERSRRIATLSRELAGLDALEREVAAEQAALDRTLATQRAQVAALERERTARAEAVAVLDKSYEDRSAREKALGRDASALERLLARLRAAAAKAEAERKAAARREAEREAARAADAGTAPAPRRPPVQVAKTAPVQVGGLGWPLSGTLLAGYGGRMPDGRGSTGVLIGAPAGTAVKAVADGTVVFSEWMTGYGMILIVDHGNGYMSLYAHNDALLRDAGDAVRRGDPVASVGNSGGQGRPALYFELRRDGKPVDPASWLQKR